jgi:uncharacterized membrane protein YdjX (TVP38/TMEM64 family)
MTDYIIDLFQRWGHLSVASGSALGLFFILAALVVFPRTILIVAAGASFGIGAAPIILVAGTAGGTLAFLLSRYIASDWFQRKLKQHPSLEAIAEAVDDEGWRIIALTRLGAPVPSALQNYLYGLTRINLPTFILRPWCSAARKSSCSRSSALQDENPSLKTNHLGLLLCRSW